MKECVNQIMDPGVQVMTLFGLSARFLFLLNEDNFSTFDLNFSNQGMENI